VNRLIGWLLLCSASASCWSLTRCCNQAERHSSLCSFQVRFNVCLSSRLRVLICCLNRLGNQELVRALIAVGASLIVPTNNEILSSKSVSTTSLIAPQAPPSTAAPAKSSSMTVLPHRETSLSHLNEDLLPPSEICDKNSLSKLQEMIATIRGPGTN